VVLGTLDDRARLVWAGVDLPVADLAKAWLDPLDW